MTNPAATLLIADDHPVVRRGIRDIIQAESTFRVIKEAGEGQSALKYIRELQPDLALLDIEMPGKDGFTIAKTVRDENLPVRLLFMTMHKDENTFNKALDLGINGFVLKENAVTDIVKAIHTVLDGKYYFSPTLSDYMMRRSSGQQSASDSTDPIAKLTPTERKILKLIASQKTTKTIAKELFNSPKTIEKHRSNICSKLDLHGAYALLKFAFDNNDHI